MRRSNVLPQNTHSITEIEMPLDLSPSFAWCAAIVIFFTLLIDIKDKTRNSAFVWACLIIGAVPLFISAALMISDTIGLLPSLACFLISLGIFEYHLVRRFKNRNLIPQEH